MNMKVTNSTGRRLIWDLPTRVFHWALAASFLGAYLLAEEDGSRSWHAMFGYTVAALLMFRLVWGLLGPRHSRFRDFAYSPRAALRYLRDLATGRARDYDGHNPAGSWAIYALLSLAAATAVTGWLNYNAIGGERFEEIHEVLANTWLAMIVVHVVGVVVGSLAHRRNLVATMISGYRDTADEGATAAAGAATRGAALPRPGWVMGSTLLAAVLGFWTWSLTTGGGSLLTGAEHADSGHWDSADGAGRGDDDEDDD